MRPAGAVAMAATLLAIAAPAPALGATEVRDVRFTASDGVSLKATVTGEAPLGPRPTIVEFSPYGRGTATFRRGPAYNAVLVQIRGTGDSDGSFDALGPRTQRDVAEFLGWACRQRWSNGNLGLNGFSASAITIYNSLHRRLPCVRGAVMRSGTFELYRDLIHPGGVANLVPAAVVMFTIGAPLLAQAQERLERNPESGLQALEGMLGAGLDGLIHTTLDEWWRNRGFRGDVNDLPILMIGGFFDVESRGAFQAFQELRGDGARLLLVGGHDGAPAGTDGGVPAARAWFDRHLRGLGSGGGKPKVRLLLADGDREDHRAGAFVEVKARDWPVPGTRWETLQLSSARSGTASSLNDGTLVRAPAASGTAAYAALPSLPTTDPYTLATAGAMGADALFNAFPFMTEMALNEPLGLTFTTPPLAERVLAAGPASLELHLASTASDTAIWAVLSDVAPDGTAHPMAAGRLATEFPRINRRRSLRDSRTGAIVQPYGRFGRSEPAAIGQERLYRVEFWPIGNRFKAGHRLRLHLVGTSATSLPGVPALQVIEVGGTDGARLRFPVLPGSDLREALPSAPLGTHSSSASFSAARRAPSVSTSR